MRFAFRWYDGLVLCLFIYLIVFQIVAIWPFTIDDMYIPLRYASNWVAGNGLVWNVGEFPVEGYTNFSFLLFGALFMYLHIDPVIALKCLGFIGLLGACVFLFLITRFFLDLRKSLIPCIILLFYRGEIIWSISGLETTVYQTFIFAAVYFCFKALGYIPLHGAEILSTHNVSKITKRVGLSRINFFFAALFLFFAGLTRPETPLFMVLFFIFLLWDGWVSKRELFRGLFIYVLTLLSTFAPYFLWRWHYYGYLFPNSIYCKGYSSLSFALDREYLKLIWPFVLLAIPACIKIPDKRPYFLWVPSVAYLICLANAEILVAYFNRLFLPAFGLMLPLSIYGFFCLCQTINRILVYLILVLWVIVLVPWMSIEQYQYYTENPVRGQHTRTQLSYWLKHHIAAQSKIVLGDAGLVPYLSPFNFIDSFCLNNLEMGHYPYQTRYEQFCEKIVEEKPEVIILISLRERGILVYAPSDLCLKNRGAFHEQYQLMKVFSTQNPLSDYRYEVYHHK